MATKANRDYVVTVVGASGVVGQEFCRILEERKFPVSELRLGASERSAGTELEFGGDDIRIQKLTPAIFEGCDLAFFSAGSAVSREFAPMAAKAGAVVIDNTSSFRMDPDVPLIVPEVNGHVLSTIPNRRIISVPNCAAIQMVVALAPIHKAARIKRIVVSTYQATSGAGKRAIAELSTQVTDLLNFREVKPEIFPHQIAFNVIPQIDKFDEKGRTFEEIKICEETKKILEDLEIGVSATAVRVPTFHGHAESINVETERPLTVEEAAKLLRKADGVSFFEGEDPYPNLKDAVGNDEVCVGRLRKDDSRANCLNLWVVGDNLRKGAALNGIQIFETLVAKNLL